MSSKPGGSRLAHPEPIDRHRCGRLSVPAAWPLRWRACQGRWGGVGVGWGWRLHNLLAETFSTWRSRARVWPSATNGRCRLSGGKLVSACASVRLVPGATDHRPATRGDQYPSSFRQRVSPLPATTPSEPTTNAGTGPDPAGWQSVIEHNQPLAFLANVARQSNHVVELHNGGREGVVGAWKRQGHKSYEGFVETGKKGDASTPPPPTVITYHSLQRKGGEGVKRGQRLGSECVKTTGNRHLPTQRHLPHRSPETEASTR